MTKKEIETFNKIGAKDGCPRLGDRMAYHYKNMHNKTTAEIWECWNKNNSSKNATTE